MLVAKAQAAVRVDSGAAGTCSGGVATTPGLATGGAEADEADAAAMAGFSLRAPMAEFKQVSCAFVLQYCLRCCVATALKPGG